jgi:hypothetical protein
VSVPALPAELAPPDPFPLVVTQSMQSEFVAPGVRRATYRLQTSDGPLVVTVVAVDTREPTVRFASVRRARHADLERRNDLFDGAPHGRGRGRQRGLLRYRPNEPAAQRASCATARCCARRRNASSLDVRDGNAIAFENVTFSGTVRYGATTIPLTGVNEWPPKAARRSLTPAYGTLKPNPNVAAAARAARSEPRSSDDRGNVSRRSDRAHGTDGRRS